MKEPQSGMDLRATLESPEARGVGASRSRFLVLAVLCSLTFITYLDRICIMRVQQDISRDLHFGALSAADEARLADEGLQYDETARAKASERLVRDRMGWVFSAFVWGYMLFEVPGGWLGDRWGARLVIVRIVIWWSLFTAMTGSVDSLTRQLIDDPTPGALVLAMVLVRFFFGAGEAGAYPNISRALARWFPVRARGTVQGAVWLSSRFGGAMAPLIIGTLMAWTGNWRRAFWVLGGIGAVWAVFFSRWFRDQPEEFKGANEAECKYIRSDEVGSSSIYTEAHSRNVPWMKLLTSVNLAALCVAAAAVSFSWFFYITFLPKYLEERFAVKFADSEIMSGLPLLVGGLACLLGGRVSDRIILATGSLRWGRSLLGLVGFTAAGLCALAIPYAQTAWQVVGLICTACAFQDLAVPMLWTVAVDIGGRFAGTASGAMNTASALGGALSPLVVSKLVGWFDWNVVFRVFAVVYCIGGLVWLRINAAEPLFDSASNDAVAESTDAR